MRRLAFIFGVCAAIGSAQNVPPSDLAELVRCAARHNDRNLEATRNYTFLRRSVEKRLDERGNVIKTENKTYEVLFLYGRPYARLLRIDDKPLSPEEERKEKVKFEKETASRARESQRQRDKQSEQEHEEAEERRQMLREMADGFHWRLEGEEMVSGVPTLILDATPIAGYQGKTRGGRLLKNFRGKMWLDPVTCRIARVEAHVVDTVSFGWFLLRVRPGTTLSFELARMPDEVWLPRRLYLKGSAKIALFKDYRLEMENTWSDYRKFQSDSRVISNTTVP